VPQSVVDFLEAIEVEEQKRGGPRGAVRVPLRRGEEQLGQAFVEKGTIGQAGQGVVGRHVSDARLGPPPFRDVLISGNPAAIDHRAMPDIYDSAVGESFAIGRGPLCRNDLAPNSVELVGALRGDIDVYAMLQNLIETDPRLDEVRG
jgi:hypothetical protein